MEDDKPYEYTLSLQELREEVRELWNQHHAFSRDLRNLPPVPSGEVMRMLSSPAMNIHDPDCWEIGKRMQRDPAFRGMIPYKTEYESACGLWSIIRAGLLRTDTAQEQPNASDCNVNETAT